jgi:hypothetical protein
MARAKDQTPSVTDSSRGIGAAIVQRLDQPGEIASMATVQIGPCQFVEFVDQRTSALLDGGNI